jgi:hypothetical protein
MKDRRSAQCPICYAAPAASVVVPDEAKTTAFVKNIGNNVTENTTEHDALIQNDTIPSTALLSMEKAPASVLGCTPFV